MLIQKSILQGMICLLGCASMNAQSAIPPADPYYKWFQNHTQATDLYDKGSRLFVFNAGSPLFEYPDPTSPVLTKLPLAASVTTLSYPEDNDGPLFYKGYQDYWYEVSFVSRSGEYLKGYLWGGDLAKGWSLTDLDRDGVKEIVLLGIHPGASRSSSGQSVLKWVKAGRTQLFQPTSDHCVSEACSVNVLLRIISDKIWTGMQILEVSTMQIGCDSGMKRSFYYWNGDQFTKVYQNKWSEETKEIAEPFVYSRQSSNDPNQAQSYTCTFSYMGKDHNPVWRCTPNTKWRSGTPLVGKPSRAK